MSAAPDQSFGDTWLPQVRPISRTCLVPRHWSIETLKKHTCDDRSHAHISRTQLDELIRKEAATWLLVPAERARMNGSLPPGAFMHGAIRLADTYALRGFSCRYGWFAALARREWWIRAMIADITHRRLDEED